MKMCIHHVKENKDCDRCERLIKRGEINERVLYSPQRIWQLEQKAEGRCEICGERKGKCPSSARCGNCLSRDNIRHRKRVGRTARRYRPGKRGHPPLYPIGVLRHDEDTQKARLKKMWAARKAQIEATKKESNTQ